MAVVITEQEAIHIEHVMKILGDPVGSHGIDAIKRLFVALDEVGMGVIGGYLDLDNQDTIKAILSQPKLIKVISRLRYDGYECINSSASGKFGLVHIAMRGDHPEALECNWERDVANEFNDACTGHTNEWPSMCNDCLFDFGFEIESPEDDELNGVGDELYIIPHEDYELDSDLPLLIWVKESDLWFHPVISQIDDLPRKSFCTCGCETCGDCDRS
tara:strand:+ start:393 stop:1040 length:648 start_codon:yes stop_codon:yes gene_type:complete